MTPTNSQRTLAQRISEGRIPVSEALHYSLSLAEALRKLHDAGKAHGAVSPSSVALTSTGVDLIPSLGPSATITPYTAPEVVQGQPADARSDIFSFGALVFEMLTGRQAFEGEGQTGLTMALCNSAPPPSGSPAVDRLVAGCVAKNPAARWQRMQKILMELKLLTVAARRADAAPATKTVSDSALRTELQKLEGRLSARLAAHEKTVAESQQHAGDAVSSLKEQLAAVTAQLATAQQQPAQPAVDVEAVIRQINERVNQTVGAVTQQLSTMVDEKIGAVTQQVHAKSEESVWAVSQQVNARVEENVAAVAQQHAARVNEALETAAQKLSAQVDEKIGAATEQHTAKVNEAIAAVAQQVSAQVDDKIGAVSQHHTARINEALATAAEQNTAKVTEVIAAASAQHTAKVDESVAGVNQRMALAEQNMEEIRKHFATLQANVAGDLHDFEQTMKNQNVAIESARTAMAQTDDLVERVVEALELLQTSVLDQHEAVVN